MASLVKIYSQEKVTGKVYTPEFIVQKIINDAGFNNAAIIGKSILDPACGDGRFLTEIVKRIIQFSDPQELTTNLAYVYGWDIDPIAVEKCIENLNEIITGLGIQVCWNIEVRNAVYAQADRTFDFIVGNPPYIRIQHLDVPIRKYLKENFLCCKSGSTDIFIAFFELAIRLLSPKGICSLITPNSYLYTRTAADLRTLFLTKTSIKKISNYGQIQLFEGASIYAAITTFTKQKNEGFLLEEAYSKIDFITKFFDSEVLRMSEPWQLSARKCIKQEGEKLGDIAKIHVGITTLCDKAYIFTIRPCDDTYVIAESRLTGDVRIEKALLKPIIKASTFKQGSVQNEFILFPYEFSSNRYQIIPEALLRDKYPEGYRYLLSIKNLLDQRDNGKRNTVAWYAYGRAQGLSSEIGQKIIFPPIAKKPTFITDGSESLVYSGYYIKFGGNLEWLARHLNSDLMQDYVSMSARDFRGGYKGYNKKVVQDFRIKVS